MALIVTGAAIYNRQRHPRLRTSAPWRTPGKSQRPWGVGWRTNWGVSPSRLRGAYGWSTRSWGSLGTGAPPSPAQPQEIPVQRQQQTRPLACCWRVSSCALSLLSDLHPPIFDSGNAIYAVAILTVVILLAVTLTVLYFLCVLGLCNSFLLASLRALQSLGHPRSHGKMTAELCTVMPLVSQGSTISP